LPDGPVLKIAWIVCLLVALADIVVSCFVASQNNDPEGHEASGFVALWTMFLVVGYSFMGSRIIYTGKSSNAKIGFMVGAGGMLSELFLMSTFYFFLVASGDDHEHDDDKSGDKEKANTAMGVFCLINTLIFACWSVLLWIKKKDLYLDQVDVGHSAAPPVSDHYDEQMINQGDI